MIHYTNEITRYLDDKYVSKDISEEWHGWYYMFYDRIDLIIDEDDELRYLSIRRPGSTIGYIAIDEKDIIREIKFYECSGKIYTDEEFKRELRNKFIGTLYDFHKEVKE